MVPTQVQRKKKWKKAGKEKNLNRTERYNTFVLLTDWSIPLNWRESDRVGIRLAHSVFIMVRRECAYIKWSAFSSANCCWCVPFDAIDLCFALSSVLRLHRTENRRSCCVVFVHFSFPYHEAMFFIPFRRIPYNARPEHIFVAFGCLLSQFVVDLNVCIRSTHNEACVYRKFLLFFIIEEYFFYLVRLLALHAFFYLVRSDFFSLRCFPHPN